MEKITDFHYTVLPEDSPYVKPFRMHYVQNGKKKSWDLLKVHDSVAIIILNKTNNNLVLVRQFRPGKMQENPSLKPMNLKYYCAISAVYYAIIASDPLHHIASPQALLDKYPVKLAFTNELCAGIV